MKNRYFFLYVALVYLSFTTPLLPSRVDRIVDAAYSGENILTVCFNNSLDELNQALDIAQTRSLSDPSYQKAVDFLKIHIECVTKGKKKKAKIRRELFWEAALTVGAQMLILGTILGLTALEIIYGSPPAPRYRHVKTIRVYKPYYSY